jgi:hypothetical protein
MAPASRTAAYPRSAEKFTVLINLMRPLQGITASGSRKLGCKCGPFTNVTLIDPTIVLNPLALNFLPY